MVSSSFLWSDAVEDVQTMTSVTMIAQWNEVLSAECNVLVSPDTMGLVSAKEPHCGLTRRYIIILETFRWLLRNRQAFLSFSVSSGFCYTGLHCSPFLLIVLIIGEPITDLS